MSRATSIRVILALGAISLAACQSGSPIRVNPTELTFGTENILAQYERPHAPLIRIVPFTDARPRAEVTGSWPSLDYYLLYWKREGPVITGNSAWRQKGSDTDKNLSATIAGTMKEALEATNFFGSVRIEDNPPAGGGEGVILQGEIESFHAEQSYLKSGYLLAIFLSTKTRYGHPIGRCKLKYRLIDAATGREIHQGSSETETSRVTMPDAGLNALRQAERQMANDVTKTLRARAPQAAEPRKN